MKLSGSNLLLLEDEPLLRRRLAAQLGKLGIEVTQVTNLAEARQALRGLDFDFALFDVNLIPHTWDVTTLGRLAEGAKVNLEIDVLARYLDRMQSLRSK